MSEGMKKFLEMVSKDENLKQKIQACNDMEPSKAIQEVIALAKKHGIELSEADFAKDEIGSGLSDDELKAVAGGIFAFCDLDSDGHWHPCFLIGYDRPQNEMTAWARRTHCTGQSQVSI